MNQNDLWQKSLEEVKIIRKRIAVLRLFQKTVRIPYVFFSSSLNESPLTIIRSGEILVKVVDQSSPSSIGQHSISGFSKLMSEKFSTQFFLVRGIHIPLFQYIHKCKSVDSYNEDCNHVINFYEDMMEKEEETHTVLLSGPEDCWEYCVLIYIFYIVSQSVEKDVYQIMKCLKKYEKEGEDLHFESFE